MLQPRVAVVCLLVGGALVIGCSGRPSVLPNPDPQFRKTSAQLAADAAKRQPYKSEVPRGGEAVARAQVGYVLDRLEVSNLSSEDWSNVEIWVNEKYVVGVPTLKHKQLAQINFQMLYDQNGNYFPTNNKKVRIDKVEIYRDGKMYDVPLQLAD